MISLADLDALPTGTFVFSRNGIESFGGYLEPTDVGFTFFDGSRVLEVDETHSVVSKNRFFSKQYQQTLVFREIAAEDARLLADPSLRDKTLTADEVRALATLELASNL